MKQEHHDGGTGNGRDKPTATQGTEATGIHTTTIAMIISLPYVFTTTIQSLCPLTHLLMLLSL